MGQNKKRIDYILISFFAALMFVILSYFILPNEISAAGKTTTTTTPAKPPEPPPPPTCPNTPDSWSGLYTTYYNDVSIYYNGSNPSYDNPSLYSFGGSQSYTTRGTKTVTYYDCSKNSFPDSYYTSGLVGVSTTSWQTYNSNTMKTYSAYNTGNWGYTSSTISVTMYIASSLSFTANSEIYWDNGISNSAFGIGCTKHFINGASQSCDSRVSYYATPYSSETSSGQTYKVAASHNLNSSITVGLKTMERRKLQSVTIVPYSETGSPAGIYMDSARLGVQDKESFTCTLKYYGSLSNLDCKSGMAIRYNPTYERNMYVGNGATTSAVFNSNFRGEYYINPNSNGFVANAGNGLRVSKYYYKHLTGGNILSDTKTQNIYYPTSIDISGDTEGRYYLQGRFDSLNSENRANGENEKVTCKKTYGASPAKRTVDCLFLTSEITDVRRSTGNSINHYSMYLLSSSSGGLQYSNQANFHHHYGYKDNTVVNAGSVYNTNSTTLNNGSVTSSKSTQYKLKDGKRVNAFKYIENGVSDTHNLTYYYITSVDIKPTAESTENRYIAVNETYTGPSANGFNTYTSSKALSLPLNTLKTQHYEVTDYYDTPTCEAIFSDGFKYDCTLAMEEFYNFPQAYTNQQSSLAKNITNKSSIYYVGKPLRKQRYAFEDNGYFDNFFLNFAYVTKINGNLSKPLTYSDEDWGEYRCTVYYDYPLYEHEKTAPKHNGRIIDNKTRDCWYRFYYENDTFNNTTKTRTIDFKYINNGYKLNLQQTRIYAKKVEIMNYVEDTNIKHASNTGKTGSRYDYICYVYWGKVPSKISSAPSGTVGLDDSATYVANYNKGIRTAINDISRMDDVWISSPSTGNNVSYIGEDWLYKGHEDKEGNITYPDDKNQFYIVDNIAKKHNISCKYQDDDPTKLATKLTLKAATSSDYDAEDLKLINAHLGTTGHKLNNVQILSSNFEAVIGNADSFQKNLKYVAGSKYGPQRTDGQSLSIRHNDLRDTTTFAGRYKETVDKVTDTVVYNLIGLEHMYLLDVTYADVVRDGTYKNVYNQIDTFEQDNKNGNTFTKVSKYSTGVVGTSNKTYKGTTVKSLRNDVTTKNTSGEQSYYKAIDTSNYAFQTDLNGKSANLGMYQDMAMKEMNYQTSHWYDHQICILWSDNKAQNDTLNAAGYYGNSTYICYKGGEEDIANSTWSYGSKYGDKNNASKIILKDGDEKTYKNRTAYNSYTDSLGYNLEALEFTINNTNVPFNAMDHRVPVDGWNSIRFDLYSESDLAAPHTNNTKANRNYVVSNYWSRSPEGIVITQKENNTITDDVLNRLTGKNGDFLGELNLLDKIRKDIERVESKYGATQTHQAWLIWNDGNYVKHNGEIKYKNMEVKADNTQVNNLPVNPWGNSTWMNINNLINTKWSIKETNTPLNVSDDGLTVTYDEYEAYESYRTISVEWGDNYRISESNTTNPYWDYVHQSIIVNLGDFKDGPNGPEIEKDGNDKLGCNPNVPRQGCVTEEGESDFLPKYKDIPTKRLSEIEILIDVTGLSKGTGK